MQVSHSSKTVSAAFDEANLIGAAGLVPAMRLAVAAGLISLAERWVRVPSDKGSNPGQKIATLVAGMVAGADSIDDMNLLRHGGMTKLFAAIYAPSTLGSFLRKFTFGHVRQLDAVASRFLAGLARITPLLPAPASGDTEDSGAGYVFVDVDDTIVPVHGYRKQGSGYGYSGVRGINAILAAASTAGGAPVIIGQRLRRGPCASARGASKFVSDALGTLKRLPGMPEAKVLVRADAAYYGHPFTAAALAAGADVSVTVRMDKAITRAIEAIPADAWQTIQYTNAVFDEQTGRWVSDAEVAATDFTAFARNPTPGRLIVRRVPVLNRQAALFDTYRYHAFFTTSTLDPVTADALHRDHAIIEQVNSDVKNSALAHLPSGLFPANAAWLTLAMIAFNLTRATATTAAGSLARATGATIRARLITIPARIASRSRRIILHLPEAWRWESNFNRLFAHSISPPQPATT